MSFNVYPHGAARYIALHSHSNVNVRHATIRVVVSHDTAR